MTKIIISCSQGASSSTLVKRMRDYIAAENLDAEVLAATTDSIMAGEVEFDVILLGPQIRYEVKNLKEKFPDKPIDVMPMLVYGRLNGKGAVDLALKMVEEHNG